MLEETQFHGWSCLALTTDQIRVIVPKDIGPRVLSIGPVDGENLFHSVEADRGGRGERKWKLRGGHRLWHAPEDPNRTYMPDNDPVTVETVDTGVLLTGKTEAETGMEKAIRIEILDEHSLKLTHFLTNRNRWPVVTAPWALSVMEGGGYGVLPFLPKGEHPRDLLPAYSLNLWSYTDLSKPVWELHRDFIGVNSAAAVDSQKLGISDYSGWIAYWQEAGTFVKFAPPEEDEIYPDLNSAAEVYACGFMTELETLGPQVNLEPGESVAHVEFWGVFTGLAKPDSDEVYNASFKPVLDAWVGEI